MDSRCPRHLESLPCEYCPLAVLRLKALRNSSKELTEEEENLLPGCNWAINHQMSNYCFFNYMEDYASDTTLSDKEIAHMNSISTDTVKEITEAALKKVSEIDCIKDLNDTGLR